MVVASMPSVGSWWSRMWNAEQWMRQVQDQPNQSYWLESGIQWKRLETKTPSLRRMFSGDPWEEIVSEKGEARELGEI